MFEHELVYISFSSAFGVLLTDYENKDSFPTDLRYFFFHSTNTIILGLMHTIHPWLALGSASLILDHWDTPPSAILQPLSRASVALLFVKASPIFFFFSPNSYKPLSRYHSPSLSDEETEAQRG